MFDPLAVAVWSEHKQWLWYKQPVVWKSMLIISEIWTQTPSPLCSSLHLSAATDTRRRWKNHRGLRTSSSVSMCVFWLCVGSRINFTRGLNYGLNILVALQIFLINLIWLGQHLCAIRRGCCEGRVPEKCLKIIGARADLVCKCVRVSSSTGLCVGRLTGMWGRKNDQRIKLMRRKWKDC